MVILHQNFRKSVGTWNSPIRVPSRLLSSRPETRGLHPVGALARPHREEQEKQGSKKKHTRTAARDARNALVQLWRVSPSARSFAWTSRSARFSGPVPPPRTHPTGAALVASASGAAELAVPASRGGVPKSPSPDDGALASRPGGVASPRPRLRSAAPEGPLAAHLARLQTAAEAAAEHARPE